MTMKCNKTEEEITFKYNGFKYTVASMEMWKKLDWYSAEEYIKQLGGDWIFPDKDELNEVYKKFMGQEHFFNGSVWSSEVSATNPYFQLFDNGYQSRINKTNAYCVIPVKKETLKPKRNKNREKLKKVQNNLNKAVRIIDELFLDNPE